ncbi:MAG: exodeoxyribonuclease VII large subunit [Desulfovibrio sp.]|nr:exodeoxyribonuclease VII large subunit [Desulfovibrio sp.]
MQNSVYSVTEVTQKLKTVLETSFFLVWIRGEVSKAYTSSAGHTYFTLKDASSQLSCVWFSGRKYHTSRQVDPLTGEVFSSPGVTETALEKGGEFLCSGKITFYPGRGTCQLVVEQIVPSGIGMLAQAFEARKERLAALGFFAQERKRPVSRNPARVALITSEQGAAIHDFLKIARDRGLSSHIRLFPTLVQGAEAAPAIVNAIETVNSQNWAEVIVLIRGGGSLEDLWCFNEECVAQAVFASKIPVLAGIGHEIDTTLADMTADLRAATPTHAAELLWDPRTLLLEQVQAGENRLATHMARLLERLLDALSQEKRALILASPKKRLLLLTERLSHADQTLSSAILNFLGQKSLGLVRLRERLREALPPTHVDQKLVTLRHLETRLGFELEKMLTEREQARLLRETRLTNHISRHISALVAELTTMDRVLANESPMAILQRGYAVIERENGDVVTSASSVAEGERVTAILRDGSLGVQILTKGGVRGNGTEEIAN